MQAAEGDRVKLILQPKEVSDEDLPEILKLARSVYDGLSNEEIDAIEAIALDRTNGRTRSDVLP
ncbi:MAG: hypothetical protein IT424_08210 [Pirellulales bacterium]|nr:hypothetical protein [Pirellulales bacterium]